MNCTSAPTRLSTPAVQRFWYSVPNVMASSPMVQLTKPNTGIAPLASERCTVSASPAKPSTKPAHWRGTNRSPSKGPDNTAVSKGCTPTISAAMPEFMPREIAMNTPPM